MKLEGTELEVREINTIDNYIVFNLWPRTRFEIKEGNIEIDMEKQEMNSSATLTDKSLKLINKKYREYQLNRGKEQ